MIILTGCLRIFAETCAAQLCFRLDLPHWAIRAEGPDEDERYTVICDEQFGQFLTPARNLAQAFRAGWEAARIWPNANEVAVKGPKL